MSFQNITQHSLLPPFSLSSSNEKEKKKSLKKFSGCLRFRCISVLISTESQNNKQSLRIFFFFIKQKSLSHPTQHFSFSFRDDNKLKFILWKISLVILLFQLFYLPVFTILISLFSYVGGF
jgi:hypothetical protein